ATSERRQHLLARLQAHVMAKLGFTESIDAEQPLNQLGVDSLMAVALSNSLEHELGVPVSVAELIKGPTLSQLADDLLGDFQGFAPGRPPAPEPALPPASVRTVAINPAAGNGPMPAEPIAPGIRSLAAAGHAHGVPDQLDGRRHGSSDQAAAAAALAIGKSPN